MAKPKGKGKRTVGPDGTIRVGGQYAGRVGNKDNTPKQGPQRPITPKTLIGGINNTVYTPVHTIMSTAQHYGKMVQQSFKRKGWNKREAEHARRTAQAR